jgi:hypothetical protein
MIRVAIDQKKSGEAEFLPESRPFSKLPGLPRRRVKMGKNRRKFNKNRAIASCD